MGLFATSVILRLVADFHLPVASAIASIQVEGLGEVMQQDLMTFSFWGLVMHNWLAGAHIGAFLTLFNSFVVPLAVTSLALALWVGQLICGVDAPVSAWQYSSA